MHDCVTTGFFLMHTRFKVFASYSILQYMRDFIHVIIFIIVSKMPKKSQINEYSINCEFGYHCRWRISLTRTHEKPHAYQYFEKVVGVHKIEKMAGVLSFSQFAHSLQSICILQYSSISVWFFPCSYIFHCLQMPKKSQINEYSDRHGC